MLRQTGRLVSGDLREKTKSISSEGSTAALKEKGEGRIKSFTSHSTLVAECSGVGSRY